MICGEPTLPLTLLDSRCSSVNSLRYFSFDGHASAIHENGVFSGPSAWRANLFWPGNTQLVDQAPHQFVLARALPCMSIGSGLVN